MVEPLPIAIAASRTHTRIAFVRQRRRRRGEAAGIEAAAAVRRRGVSMEAAGAASTILDIGARSQQQLSKTYVCHTKTTTTSSPVVQV